MTSVDEKNRIPAPETVTEDESQDIDISPEKSKEDEKDGKDGEEKEGKNSIKHYFVSTVVQYYCRDPLL